MKFNIALIQTSLVWEEAEQNRNILAKQIDGVSDTIDLIVLPEMFTSGFTMTPKNIAPEEGKNTLVWMQEIANQKKLAITGSVPFFEGGNYYNRLFFVYPDGTYVYYDKRHTFTLAGEDKIYTAGRKQVIATYKSFSFCLQICYDLRFPVWARNVADYDALLYVANWPKPRITAWDTLLKARAIENMAYCIGVNRVGADMNGHQYIGHSAVYNALGEPLVFSEEATILYASLEKEHLKNTRERLKFLDDKDAFTLVL